MPAQTRKITVDTFALFLGRAVGLLLGMVRLNFLARYLGVGNFGVLNSATFFVSLFLPLFDLGISQILTREIVRKPDQGNRLLGQALAMKAIIAVGSSVLVYCVAEVSAFDRVTSWAVFFTTAAIAINSISTAYLSAFQAQRRMVTVSLLLLFSDVALSLILIVMLPIIPQMNTVLLGTVAVAAINVLVMMVLYRRTSGRLIIHMDSAEWRPMIAAGMPIAICSFGAAIYTFISPNILKHVRGDIEVGLYGAGYKLISIITLVPIVLSQILYTVFADFHANSRHKLGKALEDALRVTMEISIPLAVGTAVLAPAIVAFLYPPEFAGAAVVLRTIIVGNAFGFLAWVFFTFQLATGHQKFCMWNALFVAALVTAASIVVVPYYGYLGVAFIVGATDVGLCINHMLFARHLGFSVLKPGTIGRIALSCAAMFLVVWFLRDQYLFVPIGAGIVIYGVSLYLSGGIGDQEREILRKIRRRLRVEN